MRLTKLYKVIIISAILTALILITFTLPHQGQQNRSNLSLIRPAFLNTAHAQESTSPFDIGAKLDEEAGISAYYKSTVAVDLNLAKTAFRTIETQTSDYIIGSVAITNYPEHYDAHVYVNKDGWMVAYYLRPDPVAKILDVKSQSLNATKLKNALAAVAGAAGAPFTTETYYDFRYPNATQIMLIAENYGSGNDFYVQIPSSFGYFERSWGLYSSGGSAFFKLNGTNLSASYSGEGTYYGVITASQLVPDVQHHVEVDDYGVLVIVYNAP